MGGFPDHFSEVSSRYAQHRPTYPPALFGFLAGLVEPAGLAWDCGTGSGQAAHGLAGRFRRVVGSDASPDQVAHAVPHPGVGYVVGRAEALPARSGSVDLLTVAQALHWFRREPFLAEARRVLRRGGVLAVWSYDLCRVNDAFDPLLREFYGSTVGPYWPAERALVEDGYRGIDLPLREAEAPPLEMKARWTLDDFAGYLETWSAVRAYRAARGVDPVAAARDAMRRAWGKGPREVRWPLHVRAGVLEGSA